MAVELKANIKGLNQLLLNLDGMARRTTDFRPLLSRLAILGFKDVQEHFRLESGPDGRWHPLKESTIRRRRSGPNPSRGYKILQDTGALRNALTPGSGERIFEGTSKITLTLDTNRIKYAGTHEFGRGSIPARPFMWLSSEMRERMSGLFAKWIMREEL